jgi:serine/threonine-protein kinase
VIEEEEYQERGGPDRPLWPWLAAAAFVIAALVAGFFVWHELSGSTPKVPVSRYIGERQGEAERQIKAVHLVPAVQHGANQNVHRGIVFKQQPDAGSKVAKGGTVTIWVSTGPPHVSVPDVKGKQWTDAQQALTSAGLVPEEHIVQGPNKGQVSATDPPAGKSVAKGSKVRVNVMSGPQHFNVPNVVGDLLPQAMATLRNAGFNPNPSYVNNNATQNQVIHQNPAPGTSATKGSTVDLQVSNGPPQVTVPTVVGEQAQQAVSDLESQNFQVNQQYVSVTDPTQDGIVQSQSPDGGSQATEGSTVTIEIGQSSPPPPTTNTTPTTTG